MTVFLVGAGPGNPDLLTVRASRILSRADVVVCDRLIDERVLSIVPLHALVVRVGKSPGDPRGSTRQRDINALLVHHGRRHPIVVRLKGGDPFLFARGGEEVAALRDADVDVEIVPGLSSALTAPALSSIPVTHRGVSSGVTVVTGHDVDAVAWSALARLGHTIVVMMGVANRGEIAAALLGEGMAPDTPVACVERVATAGERRWSGVLDHLGSADVRAPAVMVIGPAVTVLDAIEVGRTMAPSLT